MLKKERIILHSFAKERNVLRSFAKEQNILTFFYVLLGLISRQKLEKRTERSFKRTECTKRKRTWCPTLIFTQQPFCLANLGLCNHTLGV